MYRHTKILTTCHDIMYVLTQNLLKPTFVHVTQLVQAVQGWLVVECMVKAFSTANCKVASCHRRFSFSPRSLLYPKMGVLKVFLPETIYKVHCTASFRGDIKPSVLGYLLALASSRLHPYHPSSLIYTNIWKQYINDIHYPTLLHYLLRNEHIVGEANRHSSDALLFTQQRAETEEQTQCQPLAT